MGEITSFTYIHLGRNENGKPLQFPNGVYPLLMAILVVLLILMLNLTIAFQKINLQRKETLLLEGTLSIRCTQTIIQELLLMVMVNIILEPCLL